MFNLKLEFILKTWVLFLCYRVLFSGSIEFMDYLNTNKILLDFGHFNNIFISLKYIGITSCVLVIFNIKKKIFYPIFLFAIFYICYAYFQLIGSFGIWAFYFIPCTILYLGLYSQNKELIFRILVLTYCLFYFYAGFSKIYPFWKFDDWVTGYTIENLLNSRMHESILYRYLNIEVLKIPELLLKFFITMSVVLELSVILIFYRYNLYKLIIPLVLIFHLVLFFTGTPGIIEYSLGAIIFLPNSLIVRYIIKIRAVRQRFWVFIAARSTSSHPEQRS